MKATSFLNRLRFLWKNRLINLCNEFQFFLCFNKTNDSKKAIDFQVTRNFDKTSRQSNNKYFMNFLLNHFFQNKMSIGIHFSKTNNRFNWFNLIFSRFQPIDNSAAVKNLYSILHYLVCEPKNLVQNSQNSIDRFRNPVCCSQTLAQNFRNPVCRFPKSKFLLQNLAHKSCVSGINIFQGKRFRNKMIQESSRNPLGTQTSRPHEQVFAAFSEIRLLQYQVIRTFFQCFLGLFIFLLIFVSSGNLWGQTNEPEKPIETSKKTTKSVTETSFFSPPVPLAQVADLAETVSNNSPQNDHSVQKPFDSQSLENKIQSQTLNSTKSDSKSKITPQYSVDSFLTTDRYSQASPNEKFTENTINPLQMIQDGSGDQLSSTQNFNLPIDSESIPNNPLSTENRLSKIELSQDYQPIQSFSPNQTADNRLPTITRRVIYAKNTNFFELSNGLNVFVRRDSNSPMATVRAYIRNTGSLNEEEFSGSGISHLVGEMVASCPTQQRTQAELQSILNQLGGISDVKTTQNRTSFSIDCSADKVSLAIDILTDRILNARFETPLFVSKSLMISQEIVNAKSHRDSVGWNLLQETIYRNHPQRFPVLGYADLFSHLTLNDVTEFYQRHYIPNNQIIVVAGNVLPDEIIQQIIQIYNDRPRILSKDVVFPPEPKQISRRDSVHEMDGKTYDAIFAWPTVYLTDNDVCALDVLAKILAQNDNGRLIKILKQEKSLIFSADSQSFVTENIRGFFYIKVAALPENYEQVQQIVLNEIKQLQDYSVSAEELQRAKKQLETAFIFQTESLSSDVDRMISNYLETGDPDYESQYLNNLKNVSRDDIRRVAQDYFQMKFMTRVLITPLDMAPKAVSSEKIIPKQNLQAIRLPQNDLRLLIQTNRRVPIVNIQLMALGSLLADSDENAGRTALLAEILKFGKITQTGQSYLDYFDSIGASFKIQTGRNTLIINATVLKEDFPTIIPVIKEIAFSPILTEENLQKAKMIQQTKIGQRNNDTENELMDYFSDSLPRSTPFHLRLDGTKESLEKLTLNDIIQCQQQLLTPQNCVLTIFGDVDSDQAAKWINNEFNSVAKTPGFRQVSFDRKNEMIESLDLHFPTQKETAMGLLAFPTVSVQQTEDYAAFLVLQTILDGYRYSDGILVNELRNEGFVDRIKVKQMKSPVPSYFYVIFETKPEQLASVLDRLQKSLEKIKSGSITSEQIQNAKEKLKTSHQLETPRLEEMAQKIGLDELYGVGFNNDLQFDEQIDNVTQEKVLSVARKYFNQKILITISPSAVR